MPLLDTSEPSVRQLISSSYADKPIAGIGLSEKVYKMMNEIILAKRSSLDSLEKEIAQELADDPNATLQVQSRMLAQPGLNAQIQAAGGARALTSQPRRDDIDDIISSYARPTQRILNPSVPSNGLSTLQLKRLAFDVQQSSKNMFNSGQILQLGKMITEWNTVVGELIQCAADAESDVAKVVGDVNAQRKAMWTLAGACLGSAVTYAAPPPIGPIIGAVITAVLTEEKWSKVAASALKLGAQASAPAASSSATLGPFETNNYYGREKVSDYKDWFAFIGDAPSCLGKRAQDVLKTLDSYTVKRLTEMPAPPKAQSKAAADMIRQECNRKVNAIVDAVGDVISSFMSSVTGPASLVQASWEVQKDSLVGKFAPQMRGLSAEQRTSLTKRFLKQGCMYYLDTVAHEVLESLAKNTKPQPKDWSVKKQAIQKQFEISFWAMYLASPGVRIPGPSSAGKIPLPDDEAYYSHRYGVLDRRAWNSQLQARLDKLGITEHFSSPSRMPFAGKSADYKTAIRDWKPPQFGGGKWEPVPYQEGGTNAQGRLVAWAVEYAMRPPVELMQAMNLT